MLLGSLGPGVVSSFWQVSFRPGAGAQLGCWAALPCVLELA